MLPIRRIILTLSVCFIYGLFIPMQSLADTVNSWGGDSGSIDAGKAAAQREAIAKRKERIKKEKEAKAKTTIYADQGQPTEQQKPTPSNQ